MKKHMIPVKYECKMCGKTFDKDNIIWKTKDLPLCEKCYQESIKTEIEDNKSILERILDGLEKGKLRMMEKAKYTEEANEAFVLCQELVRKELG